jgi:hypothetical protein
MAQVPARQVGVNSSHGADIGGVAGQYQAAQRNALTDVGRVARKRIFRILCELVFPSPQNTVFNTEISGRLGDAVSFFGSPVFSKFRCA